jgi:hypothetical protein
MHDQKLVRSFLEICYGKVTILVHKFDELENY